ncbi:hypothetical protein C8F01DRAFT_1292764 [Mycena amicta]|nr:hypothetical protein C8F01DRAFT_1292764 [Mycena amicta]
MPPSKKDRPGFTVCPSDDGKVICDICCDAAPPGKEIARSSAAAHLKTKEHKQALDVLERRARAWNLAQEQRRQQQAPASGSRTVQIPATELPKVHREQPDRQEDDFWADYDFDPSTALQMPVPEPDAEMTAAQDRARIEADMEAAATWNEAELGFALGADREEASEEDEREDERAMQEMLDGLSFDDAGPSNASDAHEWFPYPSKVMLLLNAADNLPRLRISEAQMKLFLYILKECGVHNVPNITSLRKFQTSLRTGGSGVSTTECKSAQGNIFHVNDIRKIIANDWTNPHVRRHIRVYPEIPENGMVSELWHAEKWRKKMDRSKLSPMYAAPNTQHYYVDELAELKSGRFVIPLRWVTKGGQEHVFADAYEIEIDDEGCAVVLDSETILVAATDLKYNFLALEHQKRVPHWSMRSSEAGHDRRMPHPKRAVAAGRPYYISLIIFFSDDVSGNRSKSWNKHWVEYFTHACLPRSFHHQEAHIHFVSASPNASVCEQFHEVKRAIGETERDPIVVWDLQTREETVLELGVFAGASDNPMQSEVSDHIGSQGNFPCRKCEVGGNQVFKRTNDGYHALFSPGKPRTWDGVLSIVSEHLNWACYGLPGKIDTDQTDTGVYDAYAQFWIDKILEEAKSRCAAAKRDNPGKSMADIEIEVGDALAEWLETQYDNVFNPFFMLKAFDPTQDTPVEILHTILLGIIKYIWWYSHNKWKAATKLLYSQRLQSSDTNGLTIPPIRAAYIMQYAGSLIGRQLKTVIQTSIFHVHDLVTDEHFAAWKAVGQLAALLWVPEIDDMDLYCNDVTVAVANVLDTFAAIDPSKMIMKFKLQLLPHLPEEVRLFGPLVGVATENFEAFNAVFRAASIHSNHQAPSRDIALQLADQEGARHRMFGGYWRDETTQNWVRAGPAVRDYITNQPSLQRMLGWNIPKERPAGEFKRAPHPKREAGKAREKRPDLTLADAYPADANLEDLAPYAQLKIRWNHCADLVAIHGDTCPVGSWVFYDTQDGPRSAGRITSILAPAVGAKSGAVIAFIDCFDIESERHIVYDMPVLVRAAQRTRVVEAKNILFIFNAQHDCYSAKCAATGAQRVRQERRLTDKTEAVIEHKDPAIFLINTCAFHNAHLLRRTLPRELVRPIPIYADEREREIFHHAQATALRVIDTKKRKDRRDAAEAKALEAAEKAAEAERLQEEAERLAAEEQDDDERPQRRQRRRAGREDSEEPHDSDIDMPEIQEAPQPPPRPRPRRRQRVTAPEELQPVDEHLEDSP